MQLLEKIVVKMRGGQKSRLTFKVTPRERWIIAEICYLKDYFPWISAEQDFAIKETDTIIDIGAHVGIFSLYAANLAKKGRVYAFEPVRENFDRLAQHQKDNGLLNITAVNKGVSNMDKRTKIYLCEENTGGNSTSKNKFKKLHERIYASETITCTSLKKIFDTFNIRRCNFLKLDCEGEEARIIYAFPRNYFKRIDKLALEFHHTVIDEKKLALHLSKLGYCVTINSFGENLGMIFAVKRNKKIWRNVTSPCLTAKKAFRMLPDPDFRVIR